MPAIEAMFTIAPEPCSFMMRAAARPTMNVPVTLMSSILRNSSTEVSSTDLSRPTPAELTTPSIPPNAWALSVTAVSAALSSVTSSTPVRTLSPCAPRNFASAAVSRSSAATRQPEASRRSTVASPMPEAPPVTIAARRVSGFAMDRSPLAIAMWLPRACY
jgi:hypothetical protein